MVGKEARKVIVFYRLVYRVGSQFCRPMNPTLLGAFLEKKLHQRVHENVDEDQPPQS